MLGFYRNLPNILSLLRLFLSPLLLSADKNLLPYLFSILALTDALDGFLARRFKRETQLGRILDPLADKVLLLTALFVCTFELKNMPQILLFSLLARDVFILLGASVIYLKLKKVPKPSLWGKITTTVVALSVLLCMFLHSPFINFLLSSLCLLFIIISWIDYAVKGIKTFKNQTSF
ncbi:CDP-alcohol phosphatidyltransferase family protein [Hydrogenobacter thermophilus]|uniref:CDP-alcohol phosphatidyltransferase family protein n=1 Tax=Hydrogenobacter thermophilus TaxID=940 RepID=UPI0030F84214